MKKFVITIITIAVITSSQSAFAVEIPRESAPLNATEEQIAIVENIIYDILDEVQNGLGYTEASGKACTRVRKAVTAGETNGYGYGILSAIARNAVLEIRDMYIRPEAYTAAEEELKVQLADIIAGVENGRDYEDARKEAYQRIYPFAADAAVDMIYLDSPTADRIKFSTARRLLTEAHNAYLQKCE